MNESILLEALQEISKSGLRQGSDSYRKVLLRNHSIATEAIKKWEDSFRDTLKSHIEKIKVTLEDSSGKEMGTVTPEDLKLCFKQYDGSISREDFYNGLRAIEHYLPTHYNTFFAGIEYARQSVPPYKEEEKENKSYEI